MKKLNKKSMLFNISLVLITIIVLTTALIALGQIVPFKGGIGAKAFDIVKVYQEAENRLFYIDQAGKLSAQQAAYDLAQKGGFFDKPICGEYRDYAIWETIDPLKDCYPKNYKEGFKKILNNNIKDYLSLLPSGEVKELSDNFAILLPSLLNIDYEISFVNKSVIGISNKYLKTILYNGTEASSQIIGKYSINPSFNIDFGYDIGEYEELISNADSIIKECDNKTGAELNSCINAEALKYNLSVGACGSPAEKVFYKFIEEYLDCIDSKDTDCYCEIEYLDSLKGNEGEDYEIVLEKSNSKTNIKLKGYDFKKVIDYKMPTLVEYTTKPGKYYDDISYHIYYTGKDEFELTELEWGGWNWDVPQGSPYLGKARIYKAKDKSLAFIDTDEYARGGFENLAECSVHKNFFRLCFESDNKVLVKNVENKISYEPITYKFALHFPMP